MNPPLVTIGLITYNAADTVARALESVAAQSWRPLEFLIVDDASTDGTLAIVERFAQSRSNARVLSNPVNSGASVSRNRIIAEARGDFIAFFDDDDVSHEARIERQVQRLIEYEQTFADGAIVACHSARLQKYKSGDTRLEHTMGDVEGRPAPSGAAVARRILMGEPLRDAYGSCATCSQLARTATYRAIGGFDPFFRRCQDTELCIRLARAGCHFAGIAEPLVTQTMTRTADKGLDRDRFYSLALAEKNRDLFSSKPHYRFCRDWIDVRHDWLANKRLLFTSRLAWLALTHPIYTWMRLWMSLPNFNANRTFSRFHRGG